MNTETNYTDGKDTGREIAAPPDPKAIVEERSSSIGNQQAVVRKRRNNRRWGWKYFSRSLQPISETVENNKDVPGGDNESQSSSETEGPTCNQALLDSEQTNNVRNQETLEKDQQNYTKAIIGKDIVPPGKDEYSACNKLIEKFQEAVIDTAVRIIQAYFKRFYERKRFLRLKKAVSVIQRSLRNWLQKRRFKRKSQVQSCEVSETQHSALENGSYCLQASTANCNNSDSYDSSPTSDIGVVQEDIQSIDEMMECCNSNLCSCYSESNSECENHDSDDGDDDDDSDYGSAETNCMCIICGGWGCSPLESESDVQQINVLPNDLFMGQS